MTLRSLRRLPGARPLARSLRRTWELLRPLPSARYVMGSPKVGGGDPQDFFFPPTAPTLGAAAMSEEAARFVAGVLDRLTLTEDLAGQRFFYHWAKAKFGNHWRYADILTTLSAAAYLTRSASYLEIGVRRGRSAAMVAAMWPRCAIYGFDLWLPDYGGVANPGPDFVRGELRAVGHTGNVTLISGDSRKTVPAFLREQPDLFFDLITIDGDKSVLGVASDLANTLPRLKVGGIVVSDDIAAVPLLGRVWEQLIRRDSRYVSWEFADAGFGVAAAIRVSDQPLPAPRY